jgi:CheY-like chemotaxis protein
MRRAKKERRKSAYSNLPKGRRRRILVVEDNKNVQNVLSRVLYSMGCDVTLAEDGVEALAIFSEHSFDLVLTDLQIPIVDGSSLAHFIKERAPDTPVILLTGADRETVWKKAKNCYVDSVIFKPFKLEDFEKTVKEALDTRKRKQGIVREI